MCYFIIATAVYEIAGCYSCSLTFGLSVFLIWAIPVHIKWDLIVISVYFSLMVFPCASWASVYFSLWSAYLSRCFVLFCFIFYRLVCLIFTFRYLLYTQDKKISICMYCNFLLGEHPSSLMVSSNDEKFYLSFFFSCNGCCFLCLSEESFLTQGHKDILCFLTSLRALAFTYRT